MDAIELLEDVKAIAREAGRVILDVYRSGDFGQRIKDDNTPVTRADYAANECIERLLSELTPDIPILSEEQDEVTLAERRDWKRYWLVDPLDGTQEFVSQSGDFSTIIALIEDNQPILGVVYAPVSDTLYHGVKGRGAYKEMDGSTQRIHVQSHVGMPTTIKVAISRVQKIATIRRSFNAKLNYQLVPMGSASLKSCFVAEGGADCYVRLGPTGEWDIGGPQIILHEAGGDLLDLNLDSLSYNQRESLINPNFISLGDKSLAWQDILVSEPSD